MSNKYNTEFQDDNGNTHHFHTNTDVVFTGDGRKLTDVLGDMGDNAVSATERTDWNDASDKKHEHSNKDVIDGITSALVTAWSAAQANVIETIQKNGATITPSNKTVNITVPEKVSDLLNDAGYKTTDTVYTHPSTHPASMITGLADVSVSGSYNDLSNTPTFIYRCTGATDAVNADNIQIESIIRTFFDKSTKSMLLIITGSMGIYVETNEYCIDITDKNPTVSLGAPPLVCSLDFSNCHIPNTTKFLQVYNSSVQINITGLIVRTSSKCINIELSPKCVINFINCSFGSGGSCISLVSSSNCSFTNCQMVSRAAGGGVAGVYMQGSTSKCKFTNCKIVGISTSTSAGWSMVGVVFNSSSTNCYDITFMSCTIIGSGNVYGTGTTGYGIDFVNNGARAECLFMDCTIIGRMFGRAVRFSGNGSALGRLIFEHCKLFGNIYGIEVSTSNTNAFIKLVHSSIYRHNSSDGYCIEQTSSASTVQWHIEGCRFSTSSIRVNGAVRNYTSSSTAGSNYLYLPAYSNLYDQDIYRVDEVAYLEEEGYGYEA